MTQNCNLCYIISYLKNRIRREKMDEFEKWMDVADKEYKNGDYVASRKMADFAIFFAKMPKNFAKAFNRRARAKRYIAFKTEDKIPKEIMYMSARQDWETVINISGDIDVEIKISAIKGIMLLPGEDIELLYNFGNKIIEDQASNWKEKRNLIGELGNSYGIEVRKTDPLAAKRIFLNHYALINKKTLIAGHLAHNAGTCFLMLRNEESNESEKRYYLALSAIRWLHQALEDYPVDQVTHIKTVENKIYDARDGIEP